MEPISAIAISLALGAAAIAGKEIVSAVVKDSYSKLKELIRNRYPKVSVDQLEQAPESKNRRAVVEEDLTASAAGRPTVTPLMLMLLAWTFVRPTPVCDMAGLSRPLSGRSVACPRARPGCRCRP